MIVIFGPAMMNWAPPASSVWTTGPMALLTLNTDVPAQARWLLEQDPAYLLTYPSNLDALIDEWRKAR